MKAKIGQPGDAPPEGYSRVVVGDVKKRMNFRILDASRSTEKNTVWITFPDEVEAELRKVVGNTSALVNKVLFVKFPDDVDPLPEM